MKRYKPLLKHLSESFMSKNFNTAVILIAKAIGKRLGEAIYMSDITETFKRDGETFTGIRGIFGDKAIRFVWLFGQSSVNLVGIDIWNDIGNKPDITINVEGLNIVQALDAIVEAIKEGKPNKEYTVLVEKIEPHTQGKVSKDISDSIGAWNDKMEITNEKLEKSRMAALYKDYLFWHQEYGKKEGFKLVPQPTFLKYIGDYMKKNNLQNVFSRKITVTKSGEEIQIVDSSSKNTFDASLLEMNLDDKMEQIAMGTVAVTKGYKQAILVSGSAGIGKSKTVKETLKSEGYSEITSAKQVGSGKQFVTLSGDIKNPRALYMYLTDYNSKNLIILADDVNSLIRNKSLVEIMRTVCTNEGTRKISYSDNVITNSNKKYPPQLNFLSKIIIITNIPTKKIDPAIISRTAPIEVWASQSDILDSIRRNLDAILPDVEIEKKVEVFNFIQQVLKEDIRTIDYRIFQECILWRATDSAAWKKFCYNVLTKK